MRYVGMKWLYCANTEVEYMKGIQRQWDKYYPHCNKADVDEDYFWRYLR
jgi:hypothetical protein